MRKNCIFCDRSFDLAENNGKYHIICGTEYDDRFDTGKCVYCGENDQVGDDFCQLCVDTDADYQNYPGHKL